MSGSSIKSIWIQKGGNDMKKVLLYSGGMDSWLIKNIWKPDICLYVDVHSEYAEEEKKRLPSSTKVVDFPLLGNFELKNKFIPLRNLYFIMIASNYGENICLGATSGDWGNNDKTPHFIHETEQLLKYLWKDKKVNKPIKLEDSFIYKSKSELIEQYISMGGTIKKIHDNTFSCYTPRNGKECFNCYPCFRKFALLMAHGYKYSLSERKKMWQYVKTMIIPTKEQGGYQGTYYTQRGRESKDLEYCVNELKKEFTGS